MAIQVPVVSGYGELSEIGRGGFAVVYRARHITLDRDVALKVMANANLDETSQRRFERECRAMGNLSWHPNIVPVFDAGSTREGWPYLAMPYLEEGSLADRVRRDGPLSWEDVAHVGVQVAGAMQAAHDANMLHRDVKPENVLVDQLGDCRLSDFGIAALADQSVRTDSGQLLGSVLHAAPEVLGGGRASIRSDVYSLGSTLYELLSGRPAFYASNDHSIVAVILRATSEPVPPLSADVPRPMTELVSRAMAKDPSRRPPTARQFGEELQRLQQQLGVPQTPLRLPADPRATVLEDRRRAPAIVVEDLPPEAGAAPEGRRVIVVDGLDVREEPAPAPAFVEHYYETSDPAVAHTPQPASSPGPAQRGSRGWFWSAIVASLLAVAVTTAAIVVALSR